MQAYLIADNDNVMVALTDLSRRTRVDTPAGEVELQDDVARGHKFAICDLRKDAEIIKYGYPIGTARENIAAGCEVNEHNLKTRLSGLLHYTYAPESSPRVSPFLRDSDRSLTFKGYRRKDGSVGTRNEVWVIPTVFCINNTAVKLGEIGKKLLKDYAHVDAVHAFPHHFGCSQMGRDHLTTQRVLAGLINNPNAGAVLVVGLGCENNNIEEFRTVLGPCDEKRVRFLNTQDVEGDELRAGEAILRELLTYANASEREDCPLSSLRLGLKCGSSDGLSGITANPLIGTITDRLTAAGGTAVMTEVPEMFGAEQILMHRAVSREVFEDEVKLINDFKSYYLAHGEVISDNPSPGNKKGGISTLEEKSLGCIQKGGCAPVTGTLDYADPISRQGLLLLQSPGNDGISTTALAVSGCTVILYSTGRGTPFGTAVPGIKVSSNSALAHKKPNWIDFNAGVLIEGMDRQEVSDKLLSKVLSVASGENTCDETHGFKEINIWKDGVSL